MNRVKVLLYVLDCGKELLQSYPPFVRVNEETQFPPGILFVLNIAETDLQAVVAVLALFKAVGQ
jgi:hypothetical protein